MRDRRVLWALIPVALLGWMSGPGCATLGEQGQPLVPTRYRTDTGPYAVYSSFPIAADAPAVRCLHSLETDIGATLGAQAAKEEPPVEVYILNDRSSFTHFLKFYFPELPPRRAFFMAHEHRRVVYTYLGERLEEDLRHEAAHALLNSAVGDLPLWLDEGLAEFFEGPSARQGLNPEHAGRLPQDFAGGWKPDLKRLETLKSVREMAPRDYRESWAWVHYLLTGPPARKAILLSYLSDLRGHSEATPLSERLSAADQQPEALLAHLESVRSLPVANAPSPPPPATVRLQDPPVEPASRPAVAKRSALARFRSWLGL